MLSALLKVFPSGQGPSIFAKDKGRLSNSPRRVFIMCLSVTKRWHSKGMWLTPSNGSPYSHVGDSRCRIRRRKLPVKASFSRSQWKRASYFLFVPVQSGNLRGGSIWGKRASRDFSVNHCCLKSSSRKCRKTWHLQVWKSSVALCHKNKLRQLSNLLRRVQ